MIDGVFIKPLRQIPDERGKIMHMLRCDAEHFERFGEVYFSVGQPGAIKGWHIHSKQVQYYAVPSGRIKLVLYDVRDDSPTKGELQEIYMGEDQYCLVRIPTGVYNGFKAYGQQPAIVANCASEPHDPEEIDRLDPFDPSIPYNWDIKHC